MVIDLFNKQVCLINNLKLAFPLTKSLILESQHSWNFFRKETFKKLLNSKINALYFTSFLYYNHPNKKI